MSAIVSPALSCASRVDAPRCGVTTTCSQIEQRRLRRRFDGEHVEGCAGDDAIANRFGQLGLVDDSAAGDVDQSHRRLGLEQQVAVDEAGRLLRLRQVDRQEVGLGDGLIERQQLDAHLARSVGRHERVVGDDTHAESLGAVSHELADAPQPDDGQCLVGQLDAFPPRPLPPAGDQRGMRLRNVASLGKQQRHRVLGRGDDVALRCVDNHHAAPRRCGDIDVVEPDAGPADHQQLVGMFQHLRRHLSGRADDRAPLRRLMLSVSASRSSCTSTT